LQSGAEMRENSGVATRTRESKGIRFTNTGSLDAEHLVVEHKSETSDV
jgi:hypothetical protein